MGDFDSGLLGQVLENFIGGICVFNYDEDTSKMEYLYVNEGFFRMIQVSKSAGMMLIENLHKVMLPEDLPLVKQWLRDVCDDNGSVEEEFRYVTLDGQLSWLSVRGNLYEKKGNLNTIVCSVLDITERKMIEEEFMTQYEFMNKLMDIGINFDYNVRTDVCEFRVGKSWMDSSNMLVDHFMEQIGQWGIYADDRELFVTTLTNAMKKPMQDIFEYRGVVPFSKRQDYRWLKCSIMSIMGMEGYVTHVLGLLSDINEKKKEEIELKFRADKDSLTGLLNKGATEELIKKDLIDLEADEKNGALILMDVDDFKHVNDNFGHAVGDEVLAHVGKVLLKNFKGMDVVGRIGGDEFMIFMGNIKGEQDAEIMAQKIEDEVRNDYQDEEVKKVLSLSIGIVLCENNGYDFHDLYEKADQALYSSKKAGKARFSIYK